VSEVSYVKRRPKVERLIVYVDGFNLYNGLHDAAGNRLLWLDIVNSRSFFALGRLWFRSSTSRRRCSTSPRLRRDRIGTSRLSVPSIRAA
jgi:hypothetical protein